MADTSGDFYSAQPGLAPPRLLPWQRPVRQTRSFAASLSLSSPDPTDSASSSCAKLLCSNHPTRLDTPYTTVLAPNVNLFSLEFYNTNTLEWDPEWPWTNQLPRLVRVALSIGTASA